MFPINVKASEQIAVLDQVSPTSQAAGTLSTGWIPAAYFQKFLGLVQVGAFGASATVDANFTQAQDSGGTGAKAISPARAITQALAAGGNNKIFEVDLDAQELDVANGYAFIKFNVVVGTATTSTSALVLGFNPRQVGKTATGFSLFNNAAVAQTVG